MHISTTPKLWLIQIYGYIIAVCFLHRDHLNQEKSNSFCLLNRNLGIASESTSNLTIDTGKTCRLADEDSIISKTISHIACIAIPCMYGYTKYI